jgi:hypothetical protein
MYGLAQAKEVGGGNTSASRTNVESLGQFDEFRTGRIGCTKKYRYLNADARGSASLGRLDVVPIIQVLET